ncbi:MAG: type IV secretion system DNA-binding domain-containing protein [Candidatus Kerfeldbacteria bacterium]|nr:type IV secretion system DNA-binding domain-containing protein [Candidatus Kerfeldbacteria bacterium]
MHQPQPQLEPAPIITPPPPDHQLLEDEVTYFAETNYHNVRRKFGIKTDDRRRHVYLIGKTGMGKSTMLENMIMSDINTGHGLVVIDPLGDLVEKIIDFIPSPRVNDIIYFNPADFDHPISFNVLEAVDPNHRHLVSSGLIAVFKKIWVDSWGPRLEYVLRNCILSLLEYPGSTLLGVTRLLVDKKYRAKIITKVTDPIVKAFWIEEFSAYSNQFRTEAISPIQNKVGQFLSSSVIRNIVGQPKSSFDLRWLMDEGKILLMNLAKGRIGEDNSSLLGAMMITKLQLAAMSRIDKPEPQRRDFYMYVDEFQNFATESFATILSEARKYHLNLIIAHQYIEQLSETVSAAVFGNVGTIVCFRIGAADAEFLEKEFAPVFTETDLVNLTKYDIYLKLMIDGVASDPFSATGLPPVDQVFPRAGNRDKIIRVSRERYATQRDVVEDKILRWSGVEEIFKGTAESENVAADRRSPSGQRSNQPVIDLTSERVVEEPNVISTPPPISLTEALKQAPVTFGGKPAKSTPPKETRQSSPRPSVPHVPVPPGSPHTRHLEPGQVVRP